MSLWKILRPKKEEVKETGENCKMKSFMNFTAHQLIFR
jgi:hypothetical protein